MMNKIKDKLKYMIVAISVYMMMGLPVFATGTEPKFVTGTRKLFKDVTGWILGLLTALVILAVLISGIKWYVAGEEEKPRHFQVIKKELFMGIFLLMADVIVGLFFSYYK